MANGKRVVSELLRLNKKILYRNSDGKCGWCERVRKLECHHIIPTYKGGTDDLSNLELICKRCHRNYHKKNGDG